MSALPEIVVPQVTVPVQGRDGRFPVRRIYCVGRNYVAHIREMKEGDERDPPFFFQKPADTIVKDGETIAYPVDTEDFQFEVELVAAIKAEARAIPVEKALDVVYGYAVGLDMTRRDRQRESVAKKLPWERGKSFDHSSPCGTIVPVETCGHVLKGAIALEVNGEPRQSGDLDHMIWNVPEIIANLSLSYVLKPGDLIFTGTPAGVGPVNPGDRILSTIEGLPPLVTLIGPKA